MRCLVTGCAGFIGSHLTETLLREGWQVTGIDCFADNYDPNLKTRNLSRCEAEPDFTLVRKSILDLESFPDVDVVFHMAGQPGVRASWGATFSSYVIHNILATQKLLESYKHRELPLFLFASSSSVYGATTDFPMREDSQVLPVSPYGVTKLAAEKLCQAYMLSHNMPVVALRYFTVYGPRQRPDMAVARFAEAILKGSPITVYGDGNQQRDMTFIEDVVRATVSAAQIKLAGEIINVGSSYPVTVNQLIYELQEIVGGKADVHYESARSGDAERTWADNSKAKKILGWSPRHDLTAGLKKYIEWLIKV